MECLLRHGSPSLPSTLKPNRVHSSLFSRLTVVSFPGRSSSSRRRTGLAVVAVAGAGHCEFSSLNSPLGPRTPSGKDLTGVLQNHPQTFHMAAADELKHLADDLDDARNRMILSDGSPEACLHRRIAQLKEKDCQIAVEDIMYLMIFHKFSEIKVPLVPSLSQCAYNGRLEIWPSKDWALESIHSFQVLEMVREHIAAVIGLRANSGVKDHWEVTRIPKSVLSRIYVTSILYGYFLKSALLRLRLEQRFDCSTQEKKPENLKRYVMGFDPDMLQRCAKIKSKEAASLIENHSRALFWDEKTGSMADDEVITTLFSSMKRLVLEAVAFGSFLWETEECINTVYKLQEN